jgi:hypothetical protein
MGGGQLKSLLLWLSLFGLSSTGWANAASQDSLADHSWSDETTVTSLRDCDSIYSAIIENIVFQARENLARSVNHMTDDEREEQYEIQSELTSELDYLVALRLKCILSLYL